MKAKIPHTYAVAFSMLDHSLKKEDKVTLAKMDEVDDLHFDLGMWIRNRWIYQHWEEFLCDEPEKKEKILYCPDMESSELLEKYQEYLQNK